MMSDEETEATAEMPAVPEPMTDGFHLSYSQISTLMECQARWKAEKVTGEWDPEATKAMLVGSYVDKLVYGGADEWLDKNEARVWDKGRLYQKKTADAKAGDEKAKSGDFAKADQMYAALQRNPYVADLLSQGESQVQIEGQIHGVTFLGVLDQKLVNGDILDLKTCASIRELIWFNTPMLKGKHPFYARYRLQFAIYGYLMGWPRMFIVAVSKESPADVDVLEVQDVDQMWVLVDNLKTWIDVAVQIRDGRVPNRCEACDYCRTTKAVDKPRMISMTGGEA